MFNIIHNYKMSVV